ncbi:hypothetical protein BCR35DRAFT_329653 [Leucosporidium creatinivorum]|uniref:Uncharacterized protein n=1 Tax=Leucosporidium creatinivorum TaxID=106004 RepID=A0A1Y2FXL2_9BASI|nr:hypothetical protein BCR35DRAFT_329653 [Leucosporidium creatinivorum]
MAQNPFADFAVAMEQQFYVPMYQGYRARVWALYGLLGFTLLVALLYLGLTVYDLERKQKFWVCRIVQRPQGRYLIVNQYLYYPFGCAITSILWVAGYVPFLESIFLRHAKGTWSFYWVYLHMVPAYIHAFLTTAIVLGGANLMATPGGSRHLLPPWISNGLLISTPFLVVIVVVPSVRAGDAWRRGDDVWEGLFAEVKRNATTFASEGTQLSSVDYQSTIQSLTSRVATALQPLLDVFNSRARITMILMLVGAVFLLLFNILGAVTIVFRLRRSNSSQQIVRAGAPVVAPLAPFAHNSDSDDDKETKAPSSTELQRSRTQDWREGADLEPALDESSNQKGSRLPWDVTLFYLCTIPFAGVFIIYASWILSPATPFSNQGSATEFAATGIVWSKSFLDAVGLSALLIKRLADLRKATTPAYAAELPLPVQTRRKSSTTSFTADFPYRYRLRDDEEPVEAEEQPPQTLDQIVADAKE